MSERTDVAAHRDLVARLFPGLSPIGTFEPVDGGWTSFTYVANDRWIVQIPRDADAGSTMVKQLDLLPGLATEVSAPVPLPVFESREPPAMVYERIEGRPFDAVVHADHGVWPERLGRFLYDLHLCPPEFVGMRTRSAEAVRGERRAELAGFGERMFPLLEPAERTRFAERFDRFVDDDVVWRFAPCLTHGDLGPEHVLVSPNGDLAGVIDWEEASIGDPAWDFAYLLHAVPDLGERALAAYGGAPDPGFLDRARFAFLQMPWHEVIHGLDTGQEAFVRSGLEGVRARASV